MVQIDTNSECVIEVMALAEQGHHGSSRYKTAMNSTCNIAQLKLQDANGCHVLIHNIMYNIPVVPARGGAEVALKIYIYIKDLSHL